MACGTIIGSIIPFEEENDSWTSYAERLEHFFFANDIANEEKKRAILLSSIGIKAYKLLSNLVAPRKPGDCPYKEIVKVLGEHHNPRPSKIVQRFKFNSRIRNPKESVRDYVAELKRLSEYCEYNESLEEMLRDRLVVGINDRRIQQRLLSERNLTFPKALEIAQAMEAAEVGIQDLSSTGAVNTDKMFVMTNRQHKSSTTTKSCYRCGGPHAHNSCKFKDSTCFRCKKVGHISKVCRSSEMKVNHSKVKNKKPHKANALEENSCDEQTYVLYNMCSSSPPLYKRLKVNGKDIDFQIDTGASLSVMSRKTFAEKINTPLKPSSKILKTYTGEIVKICGETVVEVVDGNKTVNLPIVVVEKGEPPLLGRDWMQHLHLDFAINEVHDQQLDTLLHEYDHVFKKSAGLIRDVQVKLHMKPDATPKFYRARQPPYALREAIEEELQRLQRDGIVEPVEHSEWATPVVPVRKRDGTVRLCGDYKLTVNQACEGDSHPIPRVEDLAYALSGGEKFSKLDLSHAYTQCMLDESSRDLTTINTHKGLFRYHRLCFGISAAPGIFQRTMENLFRHVPGCINYLDDVYVTGKDDNEHLENLRNVLSICRDKGLSLRRDKCEFLQREVTFLGYRLNKHGLYPLEDKVKAIRDAPQPRNTQELRSFLGLVNFYGKFIPNASQLLAPLYQLLRHGQRWCWGKAQESAVKKVKGVLSSDKVLVHFQSEKEVVLICDASPTGVGAILAQIHEGDERPVAYASRALNSAERNYSQIDREGLALIFAVKKFHKYIAGRKFTLVTDHKPLLGLLGPGKRIPEHASARVQRWAIILSAHSYALVHRPGKENSADALSRLPLPYTPDENDTCDIDTYGIPEEVNVIFSVMDQCNLSSTDIARETEHDETLKTVYRSLLLGLPLKSDETFRPYAIRKNEMSIEKDCILWGTRVVVPPSLQAKVLQLLHDDTHVGVAHMKSQARSWVWWPQIDADIEKSVKCCYTCQKHRKQPAKAPLCPWEWPEEPWKRVHLDFAGPFLGHMFLIATDAHSKWVEVKMMSKITAPHTILELRDIFSSLGLPEMIVTDNGPTFTSSEFRLFMSCNGIKHVTVSPYHPSSNGLAERSVQTFKRAMVKTKGGSVRERVCKFLTKYRCTPHSTTGLAPAELMFGRNIRTHIDLLHPNLHEHVAKHQTAQKVQHDRHAIDRDISLGDSVFVRNYSSHGDKWVMGTVIECTSPLSYKVKTATHGVVRRHQDQLRTTVPHDTHSHSATLASQTEDDEEQFRNEIQTPNSQMGDDAKQAASTQSQTLDSTLGDREVETSPTSVENMERVTSPGNATCITRSGRVVKPPERYGS